MFSEFLEELNVRPGHLLELVSCLRLHNLLLAVFDFELDVQLGLISRLNHPKFRYAFLDNLFVVTMALEKDLSFSRSDFKVAFVVRVEKHGDLPDLTIETILFHLELTIVLEIVFL